MLVGEGRRDVCVEHVDMSNDISSALVKLSAVLAFGIVGGEVGVCVVVGGDIGGGWGLWWCYLKRCRQRRCNFARSCCSRDWVGVVGLTDGLTDGKK